MEDYVLPEALKSTEIELKRLGFDPIGSKLIRVNQSNVEMYTYLYQSKDIVAYTFAFDGNPCVKICSYFGDRFTANTDYPIDLGSFTAQEVRKIVDSSLEVALSEHQDSVLYLNSLHGETQKFSSLNEILDWEAKQNLMLRPFQSGFFEHFFVRFAVAAGLALLLSTVINFVFTISWQTFFTEELPSNWSFINSIIGIMFIGIALFWASRS